jgi:hypothetical protein
VEPARLTELRLTEFKSFHGEVLPLGALTLLVGGNAAGKSNALDGLVVLARLFSGLSPHEALNGASHAPSPIRGGTQGCIPIGRSAFEVGCTIEAGDQALVLDVKLVRSREVGLPPADERISPHGETVTLDIRITDQITGCASLTATSRAGGGDRPTVQVNASPSRGSLRVALVSQAEAQIDGGAEAVERLLTALDEVLLLAPDPERMRGYVPLGETLLQTDAANLSAAVEGLRFDAPEAYARLEELVVRVSNGRITGLDSTKTAVGDVQLMFKENGVRAPARLASDGTLRLLAFGTALLSAQPSEDQPAAQRLILVEEVERGLYPAQAGLLLDLMDRELRSRAASIVLTTHSPALLSALPSAHHADVFVCGRDADTGHSCLTRLTELPGYVELLAAGGLGEAVSTDGLASAQSRQQGLTPEFLHFLESM